MNLRLLACAFAVATLACFAWRDVLQLPLAGWDTHPLIAAASEDGWSVVTRELMGGRFPGGRYYRPLTELSFASDHAQWRLVAYGYHLTDLATLAFSGVLVVLLASRFLGPRSWWPLLAGALYVLHPVHFEIVPLPPRRADALATMFTLLALFLASQRRPKAWLVALACLAACASKETGVLAAPLLIAMACVRSAEPSLGARLSSALRASWPSLALTAAFLAVRTLVLGGLGGGARAAVTSNVSELPRVIVRYSDLVLAPTPPDWLPGARVLAPAALLVLAFVAACGRDDEGERLLTPRRALEFLVVWLALLVAVTALAGTYRAWYALPFVAPLALLAALAGAHRRARGAAVSTLASAALVVLLAAQGWGSGGAERWSEVRANSVAARELLTRLDAQIENALSGSTLRIDALPSEAATERHGVETKRTMLFAPYSLAAYAELRWPERKLRFEPARATNEPAAADEVLVLLEARD